MAKSQTHTIPIHFSQNKICRWNEVHTICRLETNVVHSNWNNEATLPTNAARKYTRHEEKRFRLERKPKTSTGSVRFCSASLETLFSVGPNNAPNVMSPTETVRRERRAKSNTANTRQSRPTADAFFVFPAYFLPFTVCLSLIRMSSL